MPPILLGAPEGYRITPSAYEGWTRPTPMPPLVTWSCGCCRVAAGLAVAGHGRWARAGLFDLTRKVGVADAAVAGVWAGVSRSSWSRGCTHRKCPVSCHLDTIAAHLSFHNMKNSPISWVPLMKQGLSRESYFWYVVSYDAHVHALLKQRLSISDQLLQYIWVRPSAWGCRPKVLEPIDQLKENW